MQMRKLWSVGEWQDDGEFAAKYCLSLSFSPRTSVKLQLCRIVSSEEQRRKCKCFAFELTIPLQLGKIRWQCARVGRG